MLIACDKAKEPAIPSTVKAKNTDPVHIASEKKYNADIINFEGFGPAKFGGNEESIRMAWGHPLVASKPAAGATCYYLRMDTMSKKPSGIAFMLEKEKFVRYEIDDSSQIAPGNIVVGDSAAMVMQAHAGHVEKQAHKYIEGAHTLVVTPAQASEARLIFEVDANDIVINWRIGVAPQIYYVEGCS